LNRGSLLGEEVIWSGRPTEIATPQTLRIAALVLFVLSGVSLCFAVVVSQALGASPAQTVLFSAWSASLALACLEVPKQWLRRVRYTVTRSYVVLERGPFRRTIERRSISFARIKWSHATPGVGDIDLVRAVPAGALRRRLLLQLRGVSAPDQVWAIIRDARVPTPPQSGERPLGQRLDEGEQVLWSARPRPTRWALLPHGRREIGVLVLAMLMTASLGRMLTRVVPNYRLLEASGLPGASTANVALIAAEGLAMLVLALLAGWFSYEALVAPSRNLQATRYLITNRRVLIQRGREELHLDRARIVDVIPTRSRRGLTDVFLVLDGPRARALAISGAFGDVETGPHLRPVLEAVDDPEGVSKLLMEAVSTQQAA
jgi:hypothetical protein